MLPKSVLEKKEENVNKPSFWKSPSVGEIWKSKSMRIIPEEFVRSLPGAFEHRIVLSVLWGSSWQLWLEREKDGLFMIEEDWNEFVDDNHFAPNDILCLTHDNSWFLDARMFKNGKELMDYLPEEAEPEAEQPKAEPLNPQPRVFHQETATASSSASGKTNGRAKEVCGVFKPKRYLLNPKGPHFVRTLVKRNDVLYVNHTLIQQYGLKFGPVDSPVTYITPTGEVVAYKKIYNGNHCFSGWAAVVRKNNWKEGDSLVCEFEFSRGVVNAVRVHFVDE